MAITLMSTSNDSNYQFSRTVQSFKKVKLTTLVEGDPKAPFSIATTLRCRGERNSIPWVAALYPWSIPYNAEQGGIKYHFFFSLLV